MKLNLNESLKSYDAFLNEKEAQAEATPVGVASTGAESRDAMIADVDTIITSLETLAGAVAEMKEDWTKEFAYFANLNEGEVNEANIAVQWAKGKLLAKKQQKVTTMKLKASDMATAAAQLQGAENRDKKAYILDKKKQLDDNVKELQAMVNDKAKEIGEVAVRIINKVKLKGQIEVIKSQIGNVDPKKAKEMKQRLADISAKSKEEDEAIADFKAKADAEAQDEKGDDKIQGLKDQVAGLKDEKKEVDTSTLVGKLKAVKFDIQIALLNAQIKAEDGDPNTDPSEDDKKAEELKAKAAELEAKIKEEEDAADAQSTDGTSGEDSTDDTSDTTGSDNTSGTDGSGDAEGSNDAGATDDAEGSNDAEATDDAEGSNDAEATDDAEGSNDAESTDDAEGSNDAEATDDAEGSDDVEETPTDEPAEETPAEEPTEETPAEEPAETTDDEEEDKKNDPKEALVIRANAAGLNELASEIDSKLAWQLAEGTGLRLKYESMIRKAESDKTLNENRYFNDSFKDKFTNLL